MPEKAKATTDGSTTTITCTCGHETSGPDKKAVADAHARHVEKKRCPGGKL